MNETEYLEYLAANSIYTKCFVGYLDILGFRAKVKYQEGSIILRNLKQLNTDFRVTDYRHRI